VLIGGKSNFVNPPYGRELKYWIKKGYEESLKGNKVVMLIASRTDTNYWHEYVMKAKEIRFIKGRLKFGDAKNSAPFPSCIVIF
jgi:site-specific DNA-methyltransferase (adenine-specific)